MLMLMVRYTKNVFLICLLELKIKMENVILKKIQKTPIYLNC